MQIKRLFLILGNQLFATNHLKNYRNCTFFMCEDFELCSFQKHHKLPVSNTDIKLDYILTEKGFV